MKTTYRRFRRLDEQPEQAAAMTRTNAGLALLAVLEGSRAHEAVEAFLPRIEQRAAQAERQRIHRGVLDLVSKFDQIDRTAVLAAIGRVDAEE